MTNQTLPINRRGILISGAVTAAAMALPLPSVAEAATKKTKQEGNGTMSYVTTKDGVQIFYKDWGPKDAQPIHFHHGWPLSSDDWDTQMLFFLANGFRVVAHDRRGHGRSQQVSNGHDMDHYAADANAVAEHLNLKNAIHIGHSTGGGEVARYVARYGQPQAASPRRSSFPPFRR